MRPFDRHRHAGDSINGRMDFDDRGRQVLRHASIGLFAIYVVLFIAMAVHSQHSGTKPTARWFAAFGPMFVVSGMNMVFDCESFAARHRGTWVQQSPNHFVRLGLVGMVIGGAVTFLGLVNWSRAWFE